MYVYVFGYMSNLKLVQAWVSYVKRHITAHRIPAMGIALQEAIGSPNGIRTRAATLRGWCPRPLDDGAK